MKDKNLIVEFINLRVILFFLFRYNIFYIYENIYSRLLKKFNIQKLDWNIKEKKTGERNILTKIIEDRDKDYLILDFIQQESNFFNKLDEVDCFYFKEYLKISLSSTPNLIGKLSLQDFLILIHKSKNLIKGEKLYYFEKNILSSLIIKKFTTREINFIFFQSFQIFFQIDLFKFVVKHLIYCFINNKKIQKNKINEKKICLIDSYQINKPINFLDDKSLQNKVVFCSHFFYDKSIHCIMYETNINTILNFVKKNKKKLFLIKDSFLRNYLLNYNIHKEIYLNFFKKNNIKIFISSSMSQNYIVCANAAAKILKLHIVGFTCSLNTYYSNDLGICSFDTYINFSALQNELKKNNINFKNFGYLGDYKFLGTFQSSNEICKKLRNLDVQFIIGFFDQGVSSDERFGLTFDNAQMIGYNYLLKKVIENADLGLLIKPKKPKLLKKILKNRFLNTYKLLNQAIETKRCIIFDKHDKNHVKNFEDIPAKIAKASDITIHDTMLSGTAGLESALIGKRSILFDYFNTGDNYIFKNTGLNIVYTCWDKLWIDLKEFRKNKNNSNLGDWTKILDNFDRYKDGKANKRLQNFLKEKLLI